MGGWTGGFVNDLFFFPPPTPSWREVFKYLWQENGAHLQAGAGLNMHVGIKWSQLSGKVDQRGCGSPFQKRRNFEHLVVSH